MVGLCSVTDLFFFFFVEPGMMIDTTTFVLFESSLNDLDLHSRSQLYENANTSALLFGQNFNQFG